jgi:hypothetical protein
VVVRPIVSRALAEIAAAGGPVARCSHGSLGVPIQPQLEHGTELHLLAADRQRAAEGRLVEPVRIQCDAHDMPLSQRGRRARRSTVRVLLEFDRDVTSEEAIAEAAAVGLDRPMYEDALYFGIEHPDVQRERPVVFLHDSWFGYVGQRDVLCLWNNAGRRELSLEGFDECWSASYRFAFDRGSSCRS